MLAMASLELAIATPPITILGRSRSKIDALVKQVPEGAISPLVVDYTNLPALKHGLDEAIERRGPITTTIAWIHGIGDEAHAIIADKMAPGGVYIHVLGSAAADPRAGVEARYASLRERESLEYREVILGFILEDEGGSLDRQRSRWLTHEEISRGVIDAIERASDRAIVGVVEPWSKRP